MSLKKILTTTSVVASLAAASIAPLASAANAGEWHGHRNGGYAERGYHAGSFGSRDRGYRDYGYRNDDYGYRRHHDNTGRNIALGAFATILGLALAAEASRTHHDYYERD